MRGPTHYHDAHSPRGARFVDLVDEVMKLNGRILAAMRRTTDVTGLSPAQSMLLSTIVCAPSPPTVPRIGRALGQSRQAVQRTADQLVALDLVTRQVNPDHARADFLVATGRGLELYERDNAASAARADRVVADVDEAELDRALIVLRAVRRRLELEDRARSGDDD